MATAYKTSVLVRLTEDLADKLETMQRPGEGAGPALRRILAEAAPVATLVLRYRQPGAVVLEVGLRGRHPGGRGRRLPTPARPGGRAGGGRSLMPTSIGTLAGFQRVLAAQDQPLRVFDWDKAARILKERQPALAVAGLDGDWGNTAVLIWEDGGPTEVDYSCLGSKWAIPTLLIEQVLLEDGGATEEIECWRYQGEDCAWDERVWWPESARAIVAGDGG